MRISALEEYGLRCLLALAREGIEGQMSISDMAEKEGLSIPYASKLLSILRRSELVSAVRGRGGGFCIAREPKEITLLDAITALGGPMIDENHCDKYSGQLEKCVHTDNCTVHYTLAGLSKIVGEYLESISLEDMLNNPEIGVTKSITSRVTLDQDSLKDELDAALNEPEIETHNE